MVAARDGWAGPAWAARGTVTPRLAECGDVDITGTVQHAAREARALPPVEELCCGLWSIPVPTWTLAVR